MNIIKIVRKIKYFFGKKDIVYSDRMNDYISDDMFDSNCVITVVCHVPKNDSYIMIINTIKQLKEV